MGRLKHLRELYCASHQPKPMKKVLLILLAAVTGVYAQESVDLDAIAKIRQEGLEHSRIEDIAFILTDESGPRLSNSPGFSRAANLAVKQLTEWGLQNAKLEPWGEFGRGWELSKSYIAMTKPYYMPFIAIPRAWTGSTAGLVTGSPVVMDVNSEEDFAKYKGKLEGSLVIIKPSASTSRFNGSQEPTFEADATRLTEEELQEMTEPREERRYDPEVIAAYRARRDLEQKLGDFLVEEGAAMAIYDSRGRHGTLFTGSHTSQRENGAPDGISEISLAPEHFNLLMRLSEHHIDVQLEAEVKTTFQDKDLQGYNVVAEIPGTDKKLKSELVMLGGHLDSWHGATGATDNGAGCIVMMEVVRILEATGLKPKRTIRIALWSGEEEGLLGSKGYAKNHFGDSETLVMKPEQEKISAYYNIDNGTGRVRGIYLQGNEKVRPIFEAWFKPFDDLIDNTTLTVRNTGGTDHLSFDAVGIPGFQFIQDPIEYSTRTHHTNMDTYDRLVMDDLRQTAVVVASFVYMTAQRAEKLPRKALDAPAVSNN